MRSLEVLKTVTNLDELAFKWKIPFILTAGGKVNTVAPEAGK